MKKNLREFRRPFPWVHRVPCQMLSGQSGAIRPLSCLDSQSDGEVKDTRTFKQVSMKGQKHLTIVIKLGMQGIR